MSAALKPMQRYAPFATDALPDVCAEFVRHTAASIDCDESMIALPLLATAAGAIGNSCRIALKPDYSEPAVLWAAVIAESGSRKSPALDAPVKPIRRRDGEEIRRHNDALAKYATAVQHYKADEREWQNRGAKGGKPPPELPAKPVERRCTVSDATCEALALKLSENPRGLLNIREELAGFFLGLNQYKAGGKGSDETHYLAMHGARPVLMDRKSADLPRIYAPLAALSIIGTIQPGIAQRVFTRERLESGMVARFLLSYAPPRAVKWRENYVAAAVADRYAVMIDRLLSLPLVIDPITGEQQPTMLTLTPAAKGLWVAFHDEHAAEQAELQNELSAAWAKLTGYAARLALVCELCERAGGDDPMPPGHVGEAAMSAGIELARWFSAEARRVYAVLNETDEQREMRQLVEHIERKGGRLTVRELCRSSRRYSTAESAEAALKELAAVGIGRWNLLPMSAAGGRPSYELVLQPAGHVDETFSNVANARVSSTPVIGVDFDTVNAALAEAACSDERCI